MGLKNTYSVVKYFHNFTALTQHTVEQAFGMWGLSVGGMREREGVSVGGMRREREGFCGEDEEG